MAHRTRTRRFARTTSLLLTLSAVASAAATLLVPQNWLRSADDLLPNRDKASTASTKQRQADIHKTPEVELTPKSVQPVTFDTGQRNFEAIVVAPEDVSVTSTQYQKVQALVRAEVEAASAEGIDLHYLPPPDVGQIWGTTLTVEEGRAEIAQKADCERDKAELAERDAAAANDVVCEDGFHNAIFDAIGRASDWKRAHGMAAGTKLYAYYVGEGSGGVLGAALDGRSFGITPPRLLDSDLFTHDRFASGAAATVGFHEKAHAAGFSPDAEAMPGNHPHSNDPTDVLYPTIDRSSWAMRHVDTNRKGYWDDLTKSPYFDTAPKEVNQFIFEAGARAARKGVDLGAMKQPTYHFSKGWIRIYEKGAIVHSEEGGAHVISGETYTTWLQNIDTLGAPTSDALGTSRDGVKGDVQEFQRGTIFAPRVGVQPALTATR